MLLTALYFADGSLQEKTQFFLHKRKKKIVRYNLKNRLKIIKIFLKKNYIENYKIKEIKGDASFRKYFRIYYKNKSYILASAEQDKKSNILNYVLIIRKRRNKKTILK